MAVAVGRSAHDVVPTLATQVCSFCKARKKKCDKLLPRCSFCVRKGLECGQKIDSQSPVALTSSLPPHQDGAVAGAVPVVRQLAPLNIHFDMTRGSEMSLYLHVQGLIRGAKLFVADISARYFQGIHRYFPIISRTRFHNDLVNIGAAPSAGFSALLLAISITSSCTAPKRSTQDDDHSLYLAASSLLAQIRSNFPPSIDLIQAGLLLAAYEYVTGHPDRAFASIAGCARMAYSARLHVSSLPSSSYPHSSTNGLSTGICGQLPNKETTNTWWGIVISERIFYCDVAVTEQPLATRMPAGSSRLPIGTDVDVRVESNSINSPHHDYVPVSHLDSVDVDSFGRTAQATWLLDQVLSSIEIIDIDRRLFQLQGLDTALQAFLVSLMRQSADGAKTVCEAIAIAIRALFALHWHILELHSDGSSASQNWCKSHAVLNTITKMVLDVVEAHETGYKRGTSCVAPSYPYLVRAALKHIRKAQWEINDQCTAEGTLRKALSTFTHPYQTQSI